MDIRKLQRAIVDGLEDVKAQDIVVFNTEAMSPLFERVIIASGTSNRQTKALAASVRDTVKERGMQVLRTEGEDNGEWIIVDCGAAVAHIMQPAIREYYHLEEIWGEMPVRMKIATGTRGLPKASEPPAAQAVPSRRAAPGLPAGKPKKAKPTQGTAGRGRDTTAKPAATQAAAKRPVSVKRPAAKGQPAKGAPAKRPAAKRPAVKSPAEKSPAVKAAAAGKPVARQPAANGPAAKMPAKPRATTARPPAAKSSARKGSSRG